MQSFPSFCATVSLTWGIICNSAIAPYQPIFHSKHASETDYRVNAGKQVSAAPCEEVAMTPDADMWVFEASFRVT